MNFLEALEKLKNGECEGISPVFNGNAQQYSLIFDACGGLTYIHSKRGIKLCANTYLGEWTLVNPKPVYQEQEIKVYYNTRTKETMRIYPDSPKPKLSSDWVLMKGIQKVEVKQPTKQHKEIYNLKVCPNSSGVLRINAEDSITAPYDKSIKNISLTINWEEHEKEGN